MKWSRAKQRMATKLQDIERARKRAAEARLGDARASAAEADAAKTKAEAAVAQADRSWSDHLSSKSFGLELGQAFGAQLLQEQSRLVLSEDRKANADRTLTAEQQAWQKIDTAVRTGDDVLRRGRRQLAKSAERARDQALSDSTTWKWFRA